MHKLVKDGSRALLTSFCLSHKTSLDSLIQERETSFWNLSDIDPCCIIKKRRVFCILHRVLLPSMLQLHLLHYVLCSSYLLSYFQCISFQLIRQLEDVMWCVLNYLNCFKCNSKYLIDHLLKRFWVRECECSFFL